MAILFSWAKPLKYMNSAPAMLKDKKAFVILVVHTIGVYESHKVSWAATEFGCNMVLWSERGIVDDVHDGAYFYFKPFSFVFVFIFFSLRT